MRPFLLPVLLLFAFPARAMAIGAEWPLSDNPRFWILGEDLWNFSFDSSYFQTAENYDFLGTASPLPALDKLHYLNTRFHGGLGLGPRLSVFTQADLRGLFTSRGEAAPSSAALQETSLGPGDAFLAFRWLVYRKGDINRAYPTEWQPKTWLVVAEGTWAFPMYSAVSGTRAPLGDQSNDLTGLVRVAWYANDRFAFSAGGGYIHRTAGYAPLFPWNIRADFAPPKLRRFRFWAALSSLERLEQDGVVLNPQQPDPVPDGSLLFKSYSPAMHTVSLGGGYLLGRFWELTTGLSFTAYGVNAAKGWGASLGLTWRSHQLPGPRNAALYQDEIGDPREERSYGRREVTGYGLRATVVKVSDQGNYVKISFGSNDGIRPGDSFYLLPPDTLSSAPPRPVAFATAVRVQPEATYLYIDERYLEGLSVQEGFEVQRIFLEEAR